MFLRAFVLRFLGFFAVMATLLFVPTWLSGTYEGLDRAEVVSRVGAGALVVLVTSLVVGFATSFLRPRR